MSHIVSKIVETILDNTIGKWIKELPRPALYWLAVVAWTIATVTIFWFASDPNDYNPFFARQYQNPFRKTEGWELTKVMFPTLWGGLMAYKMWTEEEFPLFWTIMFSLLVLLAFGYALMTSGWF